METSLTSPIDAEKLNLSQDEYQQIQKILGRNPNNLELEIFSVLWSEHACYKNSLKWIKLLDKKHDRVIVPLGQESAGAVDIGDGLACVLKVESHNHPCAVQPRLGTSAGLRVVTRDIISMGAKPLAVLNSLRFGDGTRDTARWLFEEVVKGLNDFEKGFGIPVIGGEVAFKTGYNSSPVVNNMVVGVCESDRLISGKANGVGTQIAIMGALTGNDGVDHDSFFIDLHLMLETKGVSLEKLRDVTVEKDLYKTIQVLNSKELIVGLQTIGSQGLVGAASEMAARGRVGMSIQLDNVPEREPIDSRDKLFSETWGRVLIAFDKKNADAIIKVAATHQLSFEIIGETVEGQNLSCFEGNNKIVEIPVFEVGFGCKTPLCDRDYIEPDNHKAPIGISVFDEPDHYPNVAKKMVLGLNIASKKWLIDKFDKTIRKESSCHVYPSDAAFVNIEGTDKSLALTMDCNSNYMKADPYIGAQLAIAEASRNIICAGGNPVGITDCLNFGSPYDKTVFWQFIMSVRGIEKASETYNIPVVSGNVSFYNQRSEAGLVVPIIPTPVIGMVGVVESKHHHVTLSFKHKGDMIFLIGRSHEDINGSEYLSVIHKTEPEFPPFYHEDEELALQKVLKDLVKTDLVRSVHDVSSGGLFISLLESSIPLEFGFDITTDAEIRKDAFLFGESQSRVIVSVAPGKQDDFVDFLMEKDIPFSILGHVTKGEIRVDDESYGFIGELKELFEKRIENWVNEPLI
ncbi:MAG: phosphoribosylformylglycinamidine synthase subunit PurL [Marinilabiliaceae bacterium]|nr:phosphoribosylformylglycinamidine synthase subunit PurL [Marinilabiliaceae bacterium]